MTPGISECYIYGSSFIYYSLRVCYELTTNTKYCRSSLRGPTAEFYNTNTSRVAPVNHSCTVLNLYWDCALPHEEKLGH